MQRTAERRKTKWVVIVVLDLATRRQLLFFFPPAVNLLCTDWLIRELRCQEVRDEPVGGGAEGNAGKAGNATTSASARRGRPPATLGNQKTTTTTKIYIFKCFLFQAVKVDVGLGGKKNTVVLQVTRCSHLAHQTLVTIKGCTHVYKIHCR